MRQTLTATSGGLQETFTLDWDRRRWTSPIEHDIASFPFIAEVHGKRYELYGDGTFDEEDLSLAESEAVGP